MSEEIQKLDRRYKDWRGVVVHVVGFDRSGCAHSCEQVTRMSAHSRLSYSDRGLRG